MNDAGAWSIGEQLWFDVSPRQLRDPAPGSPLTRCRMRYLRLGPLARTSSLRPPLVLIHGLLGYSFSWRHNLEALAQERTVYAVDLPGIGYSDRPRRGSMDFSLYASAKRLLSWLAAIEPASGAGGGAIDLLGTSHGGALALAMAAFAAGSAADNGAGVPPVRFGRLVLAAPVNPWSRLGSGRIAFFATPLGGWLLRNCAPWLRFSHRTILERMYGDPAAVSREACERYSRMIEIPGTLDYCLEVIRAWKNDMRQLAGLLDAVTLPALLLWGERDRAVNLESAAALKARLPRAELAVIPGIGHMPYEESPREFNRLVLDFLDGDRP